MFALDFLELLGIMYSLRLIFYLHVGILLNEEKDAKWMGCQENINMKCPG